MARETGYVVGRKYALTRVQAGDYVYPSNDASTFWRVYRYHEDGSLVVSDGRGGERQVVGDFWACARYLRPVPPLDELVPRDFLEWEFWETYDAHCKTMREAIAGSFSHESMRGV